MAGTDRWEGTGDLPEGSRSSHRESDARARALHRLNRQRGILRPLGWAIIAVVAVGTFSGGPGPGAQGRGLAVTASLAAFAIALALAIRESFVRRGVVVQAAVIVIMGMSGAALAGLQPEGATQLAGGAAVWMAVARLPLLLGVAVGAAVTAALGVAIGVAGGSAFVVLSAALLCALLGLVAHFLKQARQSQDQTELLLAQLEDAREEQTRAAAIAERGRIASELHDVLAHSLSGAAIQLQGARLLAEREDAGPRVRAAIERASELVKDGLANAKQAVGALRGEGMPGVTQLRSLVDSFRDDLNLALTLRIEGDARPLPAEASLALYRAAQEALTNVARHAQGASTVVLLRYDVHRTTVTIENGHAVRMGTAEQDGELGRAGGGRGLTGLRERLERVGGCMTAGPVDAGWRVFVEVPA